MGAPHVISSDRPPPFPCSHALGSHTAPLLGTGARSADCSRAAAQLPSCSNTPLSERPESSYCRITTGRTGSTDTPAARRKVSLIYLAFSFLFSGFLAAPMLTKCKCMATSDAVCLDSEAPWSLQGLYSLHLRDWAALITARDQFHLCMHMST